VSKNLAKKGWFENVVDASSIKTRVTSSAEMSNDLSTYLQKVNSLGVSDPALSAKLRASTKADALFLTYVTAWSYGRQEGSKVARVGLGIRLVDASTGTIMWKANHELVEDYWMFRPKLDDLAEELLAFLLEEMPH
jgi:TolB-like protein